MERFAIGLSESSRRVEERLEVARCGGLFVSGAKCQRKGQVVAGDSMEGLSQRDHTCLLVCLFACLQRLCFAPAEQQPVRNSIYFDHFEASPSWAHENSPPAKESLSVFVKPDSCRPSQTQPKPHSQSHKVEAEAREKPLACI